jgi:hypothetical protein
MRQRPTHSLDELFCIDHGPAVRAFADLHVAIVHCGNGETHFVVFYFQ